MSGYSHLSAGEGGAGMVAAQVLATSVAMKTVDFAMQEVLELELVLRGARIAQVQQARFCEQKDQCFSHQHAV